MLAEFFIFVLTKQQKDMTIKINSYGLQSLSNLHGRSFEVISEKEVFFGSGTKTYYVIEDEGEKIEVREDFAEVID